MTADELQRREFSLGLIGAALAVVAWGSSSVVIRHIDMGGLAIAVYRFWIYGLILVAWMWARGVRVSWRIMRHTAAGGIALGLDVALFFSAVKETTIVNATVIGALQPIVVGFVAWRFFGERIRSRDIGLAAVAIGAVVVVVAAGTGRPEWNITGDLLSVGALFAWSAYFIFSKQSRGVLTPGEFTLGTALWTAAINTPLAFAFGQDLSSPSARDWMWLLILSFGAGIVGHVLMNWSLVRIPLWLGSTFTLLIPVTSATMAWMFLDQPLRALQVLAMVVVLAALGIMVRGQTAPSEEAASPVEPAGEAAR
ncbi:MAG: DMT family transporter [Actinomycetota bacterium]